MALAAGLGLYLAWKYAERRRFLRALTVARISRVRPLVGGLTAWRARERRTQADAGGAPARPA